LGFKFLETSAKDSINVDNAFITMTKEIKSKIQVVEEDTEDTSGRG